MARIYKEYTVLHIRLPKSQMRFLDNVLIRQKRRGFEPSKSELIRALIDKQQREFTRLQQAKTSVSFQDILEGGEL